MTGHPVSVSSLGFKCLDCFIWNCSCIVYTLQRLKAIQGPLPKVLLHMIGVLDAGWVEGIRRALVLGLVLIAGTAIDQAPSVGHLI